MAKRKVSRHGQKISGKQNEELTLSDALDEDMLAKLKEAKIALTKVAVENEAERQEQLRLERKEREKNKSFEELLNEYGNQGTKY